MAGIKTGNPTPEKQGKPKAPQIKPRQVPAAMVHQGAVAKAAQIEKFRAALARRKAATGGAA